MPILPLADIQALHTAAIRIGLQNRRDLLFAGLPPAFVAGLPEFPAPADQLYSDLNQMNADINRSIVGGVTPFAVWLQNASYHAANWPQQQTLFSDTATRVAAIVAADGAVPGDNARAATILADVPEKLIGTNDLLPAGFLDGALATARSVFRLRVPIIDGGAPQLDRLGRPVIGFGSGWLIGPSHVVTNHHVIAARPEGAPLPADADLQAQAGGTLVDPDYLSDAAPPTGLPVAALAAFDVALDYAILQLQQPFADRQPLPLSGRPLVLGANPPALNIIQHPGGAPRLLGLRNNLLARIDGADLAYFTDTAQGSSGAPVCDDDWKVVGLHKGHTISHGPMNFQGKETAWVNIGTAIGAIVDDLKTRWPTVWTAIGARLS